MKQIFLKKEHFVGNQVQLRGSYFHYLVRVRRFAPGEEFIGVAPNNKRYLLTLKEVNKSAGIALLARQEINLEEKNSFVAKGKLYLFCSLIRWGKFEQVVRAATELGVYSIIPVLAERSQLRDISTQRFLRLEKILQEARQQSGSLIPTSLECPCALPNIFSHYHYLKLWFFAHPYVAPFPLAAPKGSCFGVVIGPEGGLSPSELFYLTSHQACPLYLGPSILRTETAAISAVSVLQQKILKET